MTSPLMIRAVCLLLLSSVAAAEGASYRGAVRKVLEQHCVVCHDESRGSAGLDLSSYEGILAGSVSGEVVTPHSPEDSFLFLVTAHDEEPVMPPGGELIPDEDLAALKKWIELGLPETDDDIDPSMVAAAGATSAAPVTVAPTNSQTLRYRHGPVVALAASEAADRLAVGGQFFVRLFQASTQEHLGDLAFPEGEPQSLVFSADGEWLTAAGGEHGQSGAVVVWSLGPEPARVWTWYGARDAVLTADLSPDRRHVVIGDSTRKVRVLSTETKDAAHMFDKPTDWVLRTRFSPDALLVAATDRDGGVYVWETESGALLHSLRGHKDAAVALVWLDGGDRLATASLDGDIRLWDMHNGASLARWSAHESGVVALAAAGSDGLVSAGREDTRLLRWRRDGGQPETIADASDGALSAVASFGPSQDFIGTLGGKVVVRRSGSPELAELTGPPLSSAASLAGATPPTDVVTALQISQPPTAIAAPPIAEPTTLQINDLPAANRSGLALTDFERGVRSARYTHAVAELRRVAGMVETLDNDETKELREAEMLIGLAIERLEIAAACESAGSAEPQH